MNLQDLTGTNTTSCLNTWNNAERIQVNELKDSIEFIYKETSMLQLAVYPPRPPEQRIFKVVFSCIDGIWNKSDRIYGKIIAPKSEQYEF